MAESLAAADYVLLAAYLAGTLALGLWIGRRMSSGRDYFLGGRRLPWWAIGMSLVATDIGGTDIIGVGGAAYSYGLAVANFEWIGCVPAMIVAAFVFIPFFWRIGVYTIPEYMERRFNVHVRTALAFCWLVFMACNLGVMLLASAKMMSVLFDWPRLIETTPAVGWLAERISPESVCILATAAFVGLYTVAGGLSAVVYTDMIQCVVMIAGCLLVVALGLAELGGLENLADRVAAAEAAQQDVASKPTGQSIDNSPSAAAGVSERPQSYRTSLIVPVDTESPFPWTGILFGLALILSPAYWIGNQAIVQRSLGARSEFEAKAAYVWGALLKNLIPIVIAVPGLIALALYPHLSDGDRAFPVLATRLLPTGLRGVFVAAFLAALMSSVDSYLNSAATILTNDIYERFIRPQARDRELLFVGRLTTVLLVVWAVLFAFWLMRTEKGIYAIFQTLMSFFQGPALALLVTGLFWRRANGPGALAGFIAGVACAVSLFLLSQEGICAALGIVPLFRISEPFLYYSVWAFVVALGVLMIVSLLTRPEPNEKLARVSFRMRRDETR